MIVIKRDGREIPYDSSKIKDAVHKAMVSTNKESEPTVANDEDVVTSDKIAYYVHQKIKELNKDKISVEEIQDLVEKTLIEHNLPEIAKHYILYRNQRSKVRSIHSEMNKAIAQLVDPVADSDDKRENANINSDTTINKPVAC